MTAVTATIHEENFNRSFQFVVDTALIVLFCDASSGKRVEKIEQFFSKAQK